MKKLMARLAVLLLSTLGLLTGAVLAQQSPPSADTYVNSSSPNKNFGSSILLVVGEGSTTYMKFNLSGVPAGAPVNKATLRLFVSAVATGGQFDVYNLPASPTWSESTLTFNTPPPVLGSSATGANPVTVSTSSMNNFVLVDITATVQNWLANPSSNNGVALAVVGTKGYFSFESKEGVLTSHEPELEIVLNGSSGAGSGTVTSVGSGLGLTGGPITTTGTLNINPNVVPQLGALNNVFTGNIAALSFTGNGAGLTNVNATTLNGVAGYNFPSLTGSNNFVGNQTITGNLNIAGIGSTLNVGGPSVFNMDVTPGPAVTSNCLASAGAACTGFQFNGLPGNTIFNAQINGTPEMTVDASGDMTLNGLLNLPATSATSGIATSGVLTFGGMNFAHVYGVNGLNSQNTFFGASAGNFTMTGELNIAIGASALASNTSGQGNTALGSPPPHSSNAGNRGALGSNTTGSGNTAMGSPHSDPATHKSNNSSSLSSNTTGSDNTSLGASSLGSNTTGNNNVALGSLAGLTLTAANANTTGSGNTFVGYDSGPGVSTEIDNATALGANALVNCSNCVVLGDSTVPMLVGIGTNAPQATLDVEAPTGTLPPTVNFGSASNPAIFTVNGLTASITGQQSITEKVGSSSISLSPEGIVLAGPINQVNGPTIITGLTTIAGTLNVTGGCTGCGASSGGITSVTGSNGVNASTSGGAVTLSADHNVVAFQSDLSSAVNTAENFSVTQTVNYTDTYFLHLAGGAMTGTLTVPVIGVGTASPAFPLDVNGVVNTSTAYNLGGTFFDYGSAASNNAFLGFAGNGTNPGTGNVAAGWHALAADTTGGSNVAAGYLALNSNTTGSFNVALGNFAGQTGDSSPITGNNNTFLGGGAEASYGSNSSGAITNATAIGSNSVVGESNALVLGCIAGTNNCPTSVKVGIGTTTPATALDVHGTTSITGNLTVTGTVTCGSGCGGGGGGGGITAVNAGSGIGTSVSGSTVTVTNTGVVSINNGHGISSLGLFGPTPIIGIDTTVVPVLNGGNTFNGSQVVNGSFGAITSSGATGAPAVQGVAQATSGGSNGGYFLTGDSTGTGVVGINTGAGSGGFFQSNGGSSVQGSNQGTSGGSNGGFFTTGDSTGSGVVGRNTAGGYAGYFQGNVAVTGNATIAGTLAIGGDAPMSHSPTLTWSSFLSGNLGSGPAGGVFIPDKPITITRILASTSNPGTSCGTAATVNLVSPNNNNVTTLLSASIPTYLGDSGVVGLQVSAGTFLEITSTAASGCSNDPANLGQSPSNVNVTVQYVMQ